LHPPLHLGAGRRRHPGVRRRPAPGGTRLTPLAGLACAFILAGIFYAEDRPLGYGMLGIGVALAVYDLFSGTAGR
jgi:hypothetical protein